jgi:hypothetical protein
LQQLLPHLFLGAAQNGDIAGKHALGADDSAPERQQLINRADRITTPAYYIAQIDKPVASPITLRYFLMQPSQLFGFAMNGRHRPNSLRVAQNGNLVGID